MFSSFYKLDVAPASFSLLIGPVTLRLAENCSVLGFLGRTCELSGWKSQQPGEVMNTVNTSLIRTSNKTFQGEKKINTTGVPSWAPQQST